MFDRQLLVYQAKIAEQAERFDDMVSHMKAVIRQNPILNDEERNLLSVAYKNVAGTRRGSLRAVLAILEKEKEEDKAKVLEDYRKTIQGELDQICDEVDELVTDTLIQEDSSAEDKVFFLKMSGDYFRYKMEAQPNPEEVSDSQEKAKAAYDEATKIAGQELSTTDPIRLGLALNYSVFHYEILKNSEEACEIAKNAFDSAIQELDNVDEETYKDATCILQLIRDNLTLWTSDE